jgi:hypothetical protein
MAAAGYETNLKFTSYTKDKQPSHVYAETANGCIIDACIPFFDYEKNFTYKYLYPMEINTIHGIDQIGLFKRKSKRKKRVKKKSKLFKKLKKTFGKVTNAVKKVGLAAPRKAARVLISVNFANMAANLEKAIKINPAKVAALWKKLGGDFGSLKKTIAKGKNKRPLLGRRKKTVSGYNYDQYEFQYEGIYGTADYIDVDLHETGETISAEPVTMSTVLIAAAPVIAALGVLMKKLNIGEKENKELVEDLPAGSAEEAAEFLTGEGDYMEVPEDYKSAADPTAGTTDIKKMILPLAAAAAAVFILPKLLK